MPIPHAAGAGLTIREAVDAFIAETQSSRPSTTAGTYSAALDNFLLHLKDSKVDAAVEPIAGLNPDVIVRYPAWLTADHFRNRPNPYTVATYLAILMSWLRYVVREKLSEEVSSDMERIREAIRKARPKTQRLPKTLRDEVVSAILEAIRTAKKPKTPRLTVARLRDLALVEGLRSTGARISELLGADVEGLDPRNKTLRVLGKGSKERLVYLDGPAWAAIHEYLRARQVLRLTARGKTTPLIALHNRGSGRRLERLRSNGARKILWGYVKAAGVREKVTPHRYRHSYGLKLLEATGDLAATQDLLGHASPATTRIYAPLVSSRLRAAHKKAFPR